ncbi:MGMT family protein [Myxococcota bacterium]|nr:MGMT family protein [Myxococcota bacterium]
MRSSKSIHSASAIKTTKPSTNQTKTQANGKSSKTPESSRSLCDELLELVRKIPEGKVASYGYLGRLLSRPCSGLVVGKLLANPYADAPWWRVVGVDGTLLLRRRSLMLGEEQARLLEEEGIAWEADGRVKMALHRWEIAED